MATGIRKGNPKPKSTKGAKHKPRNRVRVVPSPESINRAAYETLFRPEHVEKAYGLCLLGLTNAQLAHTFDITESTITDWQKVHPEFKDALVRGREQADEEVVRALRSRALGYTHDSEEIKVVSNGANMGSEIVRVPIKKHYPPSETAAIFWLRNRQRDRWRNDPFADGGGADPGAMAKAAQDALRAADATDEDDA